MAPALALLLAVIGVWACGGERPARLALGAPVPEDEAVSLAELLEGALPLGDEREVVVSGRVSAVCGSSGCWLVLREVDGDDVHELFVDLSRQADFVASRDLTGDDVLIAGTLVEEGPNLSLHARGLLRL